MLKALVSDTILYRISCDRVFDASKVFSSFRKERKLGWLCSAYHDSATGEVNLPDWSRFNIQRSLASLLTHHASVVIKKLRKLHIRWCHASVAKM